MSTAVWLATTVAVGLVIIDAAGWSHVGAKWVIRLVARRLPEDFRSRYLEEWLGELHQLSTRPITALVWALRIGFGVRKLRRELTERTTLSLIRPPVYGVNISMRRRHLIPDIDGLVMALARMGYASHRMALKLGVTEADLPGIVRGVLTRRLSDRDRALLEEWLVRSRQRRPRRKTKQVW